MVFEIDFAKSVLSQLPIPADISLVIIAFVAIYAAYRIFKLILHIVGAGILGGLFPLISNHFLGSEIPITFESIISYALVAIGIMYVILLVKGIYHLIKYATWPFRHHKKVEIKEKKKQHHIF